MTDETNEKSKFDFKGWTSPGFILIGFILALVSSFLPFYYATYIPLENVPINAPSTVFFSESFPRGIGNCYYVDFKLADTSLVETYKLFQDISKFSIRGIPIYLATLAIMMVAAKRRISPLKFLLVCLAFAILLIGTLFLSTPKVDCALTPSIQITDFQLYWPSIIFFIVSFGFNLIAFYKNYPRKPAQS